MAVDQIIFQVFRIRKIEDPLGESRKITQPIPVSAVEFLDQPGYERPGCHSQGRAGHAERAHLENACKHRRVPQSYQTGGLAHGHTHSCPLYPCPLKLLKGRYDRIASQFAKKPPNRLVMYLAFPAFLLYNHPRISDATVAQQAEQPLRKRRVMGSIPFGGSQKTPVGAFFFASPFFIHVQYNSLMPNRATPLVIGIAGGSGSGKTTLAHLILNRVGPQRIAYLPHDAYYKDLSNLPPNERAMINFDHPNSLDNELLIQHVVKLKNAEPVDLPIYDFKTHSRTQHTRRIEPRQVIMVEGILIFAEPALRELLEVKIFVDTDADMRFIRRLQRDIEERGRTTESVVRQYLATVRPMHLEFVEPSKRYADVIIPEGGQNAVAMEMVVARLETLLGGPEKS